MSNKMPLFSIITVIYNAEETIPHTISSLENQSFLDLEYILVDGASSDNTVDIIKKLTKNLNFPIKIVSEPDKGIYDAMNKAITMTSGNYIYMLNGDDSFINKDVLRQVASYIGEQSYKTELYYGNLVYSDRSGNKLHDFRPVGNIKKILKNGCITQQAIFYSRDVLNRVGPFNLKYTIVGDYEWLLRAVFKKKITSTYFNIDVAYFRMGGVSNHHTHKKKHDKEREKLYLRFFPKKYIGRRISDLKRIIKRCLNY